MKRSVQTLLILFALCGVGILAIWLQYGEIFFAKGRTDLVSLEDYYFETSVPTLDGERQLAINLVGGAVDFIVLIHGDNRGFPRYVGSKLGKDEVIGQIYETSFSDRIEISGTEKAYEISNGIVTEKAFSHRMSSREIPDLLGALGDEFTLERLETAIEAL